MSSNAPTASADQPSAHLVWRLVTILGVLALAWTLILGSWLPPRLAARIEQQASSTLGTPVRLQRLRFNPWTLKASLSGLRIGPATSPFLQVDELQAQLSLESLWRLAPVLRQLTIQHPRLWIERELPQRFNFTPLLERLSQPSGASSQSESHVALFNIQLNDGDIRYSDRVLHEEHEIDRLHLGVPFISNLPSDVEVNVEPRLDARVDGAALHLQGQTLPFTTARRSQLNVNWSGVDLARAANALRPLLPPDARLDVTRGRLDLALQLAFEARTAPAVPRLSVQGNVALSDVDAVWPARGLKTQWRILRFQGLNSAPLEKQVSVQGVNLEGWRVDWQTAPSANASESPAPSRPDHLSGASSQAPRGAASTAWQWKVGRAHVSADVLHMAAGHGPWPSVGPVLLDVQGLSSSKTAPPARLTLDVTSPQGGTCHVKGAARAGTPSAQLNVAVAGWELTPWLAALDSTRTGLHGLPLAVDHAELNLHADVSADMTRLNVEHGDIQIKALKANAFASGSDHVNAQALGVQDLSAEVALAPTEGGPALRSLHVPALVAQALNLHATRGPDGRWFDGAFDPAAASSSQGSAAAASQGSRASAAPRPGRGPADIRLDQVSCTDCSLAMTDETVSPSAQVALSGMRLSLQGVSNDPQRSIQAELDTLAQGKGEVRLRGRVRPQPLNARFQVAVAGLDLRVLQPYIDPFVNVQVDSARADIQGDLSLDAAPGDALRLGYRGRAALGHVHVLDSVTRADLLSWQALSLDNLDLGWQPQKLHADLGRVALNNFYGRIIINPQGQLNLAQILRKNTGGQARSLTSVETAASAAAPTASAASGADAGPANAIAASDATSNTSPNTTTVARASPATSPAPGAVRAPEWDVRWRHIGLTKGRVDFTDNFVQPHYSAHLTQIHGSISGVSSRQPQPASVQVSAALDDSAPVSISGEVQPLGSRLYTDINGSATGIELTRLSTYAARYAGYAVEKGTLSMKVHYRVNQGRLEAQNQIFLDQLTFGEKVDSPEATKLPVLLAVSLLKDSRGQINVDLPISGSLDDPHFSIGGIIWRVILNLLTKAILSPFTLLGGGGSEQLGFVPFAPGSIELSAPAKQSLDQLATKLADRPALRLDVTGHADPVADLDGLRDRYVDRLMRIAKAKATDQAPPEVTIGAQERDRWLAAAYKEADIKKPQNFIGLTKTLPPEQMLALLRAAAPTDNAALLRLADRRGDAVKAYLVTKLPPDRVLLTASKIAAPAGQPSEGPGPRVQFSLH